MDKSYTKMANNSIFYPRGRLKSLANYQPNPLPITHQLRVYMLSSLCDYYMITMRLLCDSQSLAYPILEPFHQPATPCERILKHSQKVRRNPFLRVFFLKINAPFLITLHGGNGACGGNFPPFRHFRHMSFSCTTSEKIRDLYTC